MTGRALVISETLRRLDTRSPEQVEAGRIEGQVLRGVDRREWDIPLYGGFLSLIRKSYDVDVYSAAAALLAQHGVEIEVHQFNEPPSAALQGIAALANTDVSASTIVRDRATVKSINGVRVPRERIPQTEEDWVGQVYPPVE